MGKKTKAPKKAKNKAPVEDEKLFDDELIDHIVTQEDLDLNPELVEEGTKVGDTIQIPKEEDEEDEEDKDDDEDDDDEEDKDEEEEEDKDEEDEEEEVVTSVPKWAIAKGIKPKKSDEDGFRTQTEDKPVNRDEKVPSYMKVQ